MSVNSVILIGNLTKDPEVRASTGQNQTSVCIFSIAVNTGYGDNQRVDYPTIVAFGRTAENIGKYCSKGSKVAVAGRIQTGSYDKDGQRVYTTDVVANSVEFLSKKQEDQNPWEAR